MGSFTHTALGKLGTRVCRLGLSATQRPGDVAIEQGPLDEEDMAFMRDFGDAVHSMKKWFM